jgi:hypothetical protein
MMGEGVALVGIAEIKSRPVHEVAVQNPFKKRAEDCANDHADGGPKNKMHHMGEKLKPRAAGMTARN